VLVGLGEGVSPAAAVDVIARSVPAQERSRAVAFVFNGFNIGSVLGLSLAPAIIENFGWRVVFVTFGTALGVSQIQRPLFADCPPVITHVTRSETLTLFFSNIRRLGRVLGGLGGFGGLSTGRGDARGYRG
jgi:predicted MFS family arabinose efflux permease